MRTAQTIFLSAVQRSNKRKEGDILARDETALTVPDLSSHFVCLRGVKHASTFQSYHLLCSATYSNNNSTAMIESPEDGLIPSTWWKPSFPSKAIMEKDIQLQAAHFKSLSPTEQVEGDEIQVLCKKRSHSTALAPNLAPNTKMPFLNVCCGSAASRNVHKRRSHGQEKPRDTA